MDEDYFAGCRCDHATSSSGLFQSSASAASLNNAVWSAAEGGAFIEDGHQCASRETKLHCFRQSDLPMLINDCFNRSNHD
jgi:hypothetical protein